MRQSPIAIAPVTAAITALAWSTGAMLRNAGPYWRLAGVAAVLLVIVAPARAAGSLNVPTPDALDQAAPPYRLDVGKLDGGSSDFQVDDPATRLVAQAAGAPASAGATAAEHGGESASE